MLTANIPSCKLDTVWYSVSHVIRQLHMQYTLCGTPGGNAKSWNHGVDIPSPCRVVMANLLANSFFLTQSADMGQQWHTFTVHTLPTSEKNISCLTWLETGLMRVLPLLKRIHLKRFNFLNEIVPSPLNHFISTATLNPGRVKHSTHTTAHKPTAMVNYSLISRCQEAESRWVTHCHC